MHSEKILHCVTKPIIRYAHSYILSSLVNHVGRYFYIFTEIYRAGMILRVKYPPGKQFDEILPGGYDF